ncbi:engulfment and cell motility protein 1-like isoform X2 [Mytilus californianus]|uniref:engulfment and cell motility protein 1-like isoform X2 n=1 Tax=Mytilus californianus TaxID=6549 RepID=UPI002245371B|nr:engulfment and cell motility protein 1-like isoform X2 [Mytilus californianus]
MSQPDLRATRVLSPNRASTLSTTSSRSQQDNVKKIAITADGKLPLLRGIDQNRPLAAIIQDIASEWTLENAADYALQFTEPNRQVYITERNRAELQNGNVLLLTWSPEKSAKDLYKSLTEGRAEEKLESLKRLQKLATDSTFAHEFINKQGHMLIMKYVIEGKNPGDPMAYQLKSFMALMEHGVVEWDIIEQDFTKRIVDCIISPKSGISPLQSALEILENVVLHCSDLTKHPVIEQHMTPERIQTHLQSNDVQKNAIALLNALFIKAGPEKRKKLADSVQSRAFRNVLMSSVFGGKLGSEMAHQLYKLQTLLLNMYEEKMMTPADPNSQSVTGIIETLRKPVLDIEADSNQLGNRKSNVYKKLGFEDSSHPAQDFVRHTPPGILALDNVYYFAQNQSENYIKVVLENSCREDKHDCPFIRSSIMLTRVLCNILKIGEPPSDDGKTYYPMFFNDDKPFEKLFCICIQLLNKTWREMRASEEDFPKVLSVVKEQITRALQVQPRSFEVLKTRLQTLTYQDILKLWAEDRQKKEDWESQAKPIIELRQHITPDMLNLIKQQRINFLMEGTNFQKFNYKGKIRDKYWFWRLAPNSKSFLYADCSENCDVALDDLTNKLTISEMKSILVGKDCQHAKKAKGAINLYFAIQPQPSSSENPENFCFVAKDETELDMWTDGLNVLLGNEMDSSQKNKDLELLLNMETKIHLLDIEGITIPSETPQIPPEPNNFDFVYTNF